MASQVLSYVTPTTSFVREHQYQGQRVVPTPMQTTPSALSPPPLIYPRVETSPGREKDFVLKKVPVEECPEEFTDFIAELRFTKILTDPDHKDTFMWESLPAICERFQNAKELRCFYETTKKANASNVYNSTDAAESGEHKLIKNCSKQIFKQCQEIYQKCWLEPYLLQVGVIPQNSILLVDFSSILDESDLCDIDTSEGIDAWDLTGKAFDKAKIGSKKFVKMNKGKFMYSDLGCGYGAGDRQAVEATKHDNLHKVCPAIDTIQRALGMILKHYGGSEVVSNDGTTPYRCTLMHTLQEYFQSPHVDYSEDDIATRSRKRDDEKHEIPKPWSADFPIKAGGLKLNFWYGYDENFYGHQEGMEIPVNNRAITISVPLQYLIIWRADVVHSGGLDDDFCSGATRIHVYLPSTEYQARGIYGRAGTIQTEPYSGFLYPRDQTHVGKERRTCGKRKLSKEQQRHGL